MAFNKITAAPNNAPVIRNFKASIRYSMLAIFFGLCGAVWKISLSIWTDEKTATILPAIDDFALSALKKTKILPLWPSLKPIAQKEFQARFFLIVLSLGFSSWFACSIEFCLKFLEARLSYCMKPLTCPCRTLRAWWKLLHPVSGLGCFRVF